jgi:hypothetical protein
VTGLRNALRAFGSKLIAPLRSQPLKPTEPGLVRVGRWMSVGELDAMQTSGFVQEGAGGTTYVARPANAEAYRTQASPGTYYVEFDVPRSCLLPAGNREWAQIPGPNSFEARFRLKRGEAAPQFPRALNISNLEVKQ